MRHPSILCSKPNCLWLFSSTGLQRGQMSSDGETGLQVTFVYGTGGFLLLERAVCWEKTDVVCHKNLVSHSYGLLFGHKTSAGIDLLAYWTERMTSGRRGWGDSPLTMLTKAGLSIFLCFQSGWDLGIHQTACSQYRG